MTRLKLRAALGVLLILVIVLSACASQTPAPAPTQASGAASSAGSQAAAGSCATKKDHYKIGFANLTEDIVFTKLVREGIERKAKDVGNIDLVLADNKLDGATALANADNFLTQGVNGVIEFQTDEKFGNVIMDKFRKQNIPVIAIDIPMPGATFFGADNYRAGRLAGEAAARWAKDKWNGQVDAILLLELPQSGPIPAARMQGMLEGLQDNLPNKVPDDKVFHLDSKNTQDEAFRVVGDTLPKIPDATHIVGMTINDGTALGTIAALEAANRKDQAIVVGQGADPSGQAEMMKEGSIYLGATGYFPENYGDKIIPAMLDMLECKPVPPAIYVDHVFITKDNLCQYYPDAEGCKK
ncbi:MAG: sugar ABC transporter substrate-binding protein [Ardenticatenaceae bacterium]|nr:sugar ABC transporter substrate-binding protein [Ardenticatenaceae bacterium]HBY95800.1 sugar ABC transporter substrate-binding protein [Chloroflexota bacterium]